MFEFFDFIWTWLTTGIYEFATEAFAYALKWAILAKIKTTIWFLAFGWEIASTLVDELGIIDLLDEGFDLLPESAANLLLWFDFPSIINTVLGANISAWIIRITPGI